MCMFSKSTIVLIIVLLSGVVGYYLWNRQKAPAVHHVTEPRLRVVNVLSKDLYDDAHILGSEHVNFSDVQKEAQSWNKEDVIVFYCSNFQCQASGEAARQVKALGFEHVMAYEGGMAEWYQLHKAGDADYAFEGPATQGYLQIVVPQPTHIASAVHVITALELKNLIHAHKVVEPTHVEHQAAAVA